MRHPYFDLPRPIVLGHRGAAGHAPENTLLSIARGLELGAQIIESDVHVTRDGVPILLHDPTVDRVSDATGAADAFSLAELKRLDAAHHFNANAEAGPHPYRGLQISIPSVEEAFEAFPEARFNLEIKSAQPQLVATLCELIERYERANRTLLVAASSSLMEEIRRICTERSTNCALGASTGDVLAVVQAAQAGVAPPRDAMVLQIPPDFAGDPLVTPQLIEHAHAHDIQIHVWTINEPEQIQHFVALGVDGIISDFPDRVAKIAKSSS